ISNSTDRFDLIISSIPIYSRLFNQYYFLSSLPREHLLLLHKSVLHSSFLARYFLPNSFLQSQLEFWQDQILLDNQQLHDLDQFSPFTIVSALHFRSLIISSC
ncbi:unnamed protein product, partial [Rotaria magnacalcarata]